MSGFFSSLLSLLLGWIRALANQLWALAGSEKASALGRFLAGHWLWLVIFLCAAGVLMDLLVYFFRWRPDYVWATRLRHLRHRKSQPEEVPVYEEPVSAPPEISPYAPPAQSESDFPEWSEPEPSADWDDQPGDYGTPQPEPVTYYHDVQAGFAPPVPPEQLYTPSPSYQAPLHPGLDEDAFRQSFGLQTDEEAVQERRSSVVYVPAFRPFTAVSEESPAPAPSPLSRLARRARSLVSVEAEDAPTIHDLQTTVDVSQAFHAPVYPQPLKHKEG